MRFQREWLRRVLRVPYVPTLGPVHPDTLCPELFDDVLAASQTGQVLPLDKDRRWSQRKDHTLLAKEIIHRPDHTIIPTVSRRNGGTVSTYYYGTRPPDLAVLLAAARRCCGVFGARAGRVIWFEATSPAPEASLCTRVLLKVFGTPQPPRERPPDPIRVLDTCPPAVQASFSEFAHQLPTTGFAFVHRRWRAGHLDGPILVALAQGRIIGAIGPLNTLPDRRGQRALLPQYFGVLPEHRGHGHGRALWRAATAWAEQHRATYQLLQAETGQVSERLFLSEGLTCLGFTCALAA